MKAQVQAISLILVTGIVVSLAGAAYFWGKPLMDKRTTMTDVSTAETFILRLNDIVLDVARNRGEKSVNVPPLSASYILVNTSDGGNEFVYRFVVTQSMLEMGTQTKPIPIETRHEEPVGTYGESPRIITLEGDVSEAQYLMTLRLKYRELDTDTPVPKGYKIVLNDEGRAGNQKITVSYGGTETGVADNGGDLLKTIIDVRIS
jgi:hypothetical protein